jgi:hypothetical protein
LSAPIPFDLEAVTAPEAPVADPEARRKRQHIEALRRAQTLGWEVVVHLRGDIARDLEKFPSPWVTGKVTKISPTGAFAVVGDVHVPDNMILRVEQKVKSR